MLEAHHTFTRKLNNSSVTVTLSDKLNYDALKIEIQDDGRLSSFKMIIDNEYIRNKDFHFSNYFGSVARLYHYLENHFDSLCLTDDGDILMEIQVTIQGEAGRKTYRLQTVREHTNQIEQIVHQIQKIHEQLQEASQRTELQIVSCKQIQKVMQNSTFRSISSLQEHIRELNYRIDNEKESSGNNFQFLKRQLEQQDQKIEDLRRQSNKYITQGLSTVHSSIEEIKVQQKRFENHIQDINKTAESQQNQYRQMQQLVNKLENLRKISFASIMMHPQNPHGQSFLIKEELESVRIYRQGQDGRYRNYIFNHQLATRRVSTLRIKQIKTNNKDIMLGIGSTDAFANENAFNYQSALSYYSHGYVFNSGKWSQTNQTVQDGMIVTMKVDLKDFIVQWFIDGLLAATATINENLRQKDLFPIVMMLNVGDELQILL